MEDAVTIAIILILLFAAVSIHVVPADVRIVDGDSLVRRGRRWRIAGYDAPEHDQPGGDAATAHLGSLLGGRRAIAFVGGNDVYGRRVARILTIRGPLAWRMLLAGHGFAASGWGVLPMITARILRRGMWNGTHDVVNPAEWRRTHPKPGRTPVPFRTRRSGGGFSFRTSYGAKGLRLPGGFIIP